jgi:hypothetical protein
MKKLSTLSESDIEHVSHAFKLGLQYLLRSQVRILNESIQNMDLECKSQGNKSGHKFQISMMDAGNIQDFHEGLNGRLGFFSLVSHVSYIN